MPLLYFMGRPLEVARRGISREQVQAAINVATSATQAAATLGVSRCAFHAAVERWGLPDSTFTGEDRARSIPITEAAHEVIDGLILSDAYLTKPRPKGFTSQFRLETTHEPYASFVAETLAGLGIQAKVWTRKPRLDHFTGTVRPSYVAMTIGSTEFMAERKRWYPDGTKIVPKDLRNTPAMWRMEHIGDGNLYVRGGSKALTLATNGFQLSEVEFLRDLLRQVGIHALIYRVYKEKANGQHTLRMFSYAPKFLEYIGQCPTEFFAYKWAHFEKMECTWCGVPCFPVLSNRWVRLCDQCHPGLKSRKKNITI